MSEIDIDVVNEDMKERWVKAGVGTFFTDNVSELLKCV